jgi:hypothetical protein
MSDLPDWFNIRRYDPAKGLDAGGWLKQLTIRWYLSTFFQDCMAVELFEVAENQAKEYFRLVKANPIIPPGNELAPFNTWEEWLKALQYRSRAVRSLTEPEVDLGEGIEGVAVNLYASNEQLVEDFKQWLREARDTRQPGLSKRFTTEDFSKWHRLRILAYLDLTFWAKVDGSKLTNQTLGIALFPNEYTVDLADRIRRTVRPCAEQLCCKAVIQALGRQVDQILAARNL